MNKAKFHARPASSRADRRVSKAADAATSLALLDKGMEVDILTFGQFSIIDAIEAVLEKTGPAAVTLATWTAAQFDLAQIEAQLLRANITSLRLIIDRSFVSRHPRFVDAIHEAFGQGSVRTTRTHAKFVVITNDDWNIVIRTSMNLNHNPRLEYLQVCDCRELAQMYLQVADEIFAEEPEGLGSRRGVPALDGIDSIPVQNAISMGATINMGPTVRMK